MMGVWKRVKKVITRPLYLRDDIEAQIAQLGYDQTQAALLRQFARDGYVIVDLEIEDFDQLADQIVAEVDPHYLAGCRIQDAWQFAAGPKRLATEQKVLDLLKILYGREAFPFQTLNFSEGTEQRTHSDTVHFDAVPIGYMGGVWVALEDVDANNGPLHYYPGSHLLPQLTLADAGIRGSEDYSYGLYQNHYEPMIEELIADKKLRKEEAYVRRGQALIWAANLLHGGSPILEAGRSRHSQVTHYYFENCFYYTPLLSDPLIGRVFQREPIDVRTNEKVAPTYLGLQIKPKPIRRFKRWLKEQIVRAPKPTVNASTYKH